MGSLDTPRIRYAAGERLSRARTSVLVELAALGASKTELVGLRQEVNTNADGAYDNPDDLAHVDAVMAELVTAIQDFANNL